jgi:hypothetical protein
MRNPANMSSDPIRSFHNDEEYTESRGARDLTEWLMQRLSDRGLGSLILLLLLLPLSLALDIVFSFLLLAFCVIGTVLVAVSSIMNQYHSYLIHILPCSLSYA